MGEFVILAAQIMALLIFAAAFRASFENALMPNYVKSWMLANVAFATAFFTMLFTSELQDTFTGFLAHVLIIAGLGLFLSGARQFNSLPTSIFLTYAPAIFTALMSLTVYVGVPKALISIAFHLLTIIMAVTVSYTYLAHVHDLIGSRRGISIGYLFMAGSCLSAAALELPVLQPVLSALPEGLAPLLPSIFLMVFIMINGAFSLAVIHERKAFEFRDMAHRDPLTGIYNRRKFTTELQSVMYQGNEKPLAVIQFDLDYFKSINDRFGHAAGDEALKICADIMMWHIRDNDCLARIGGEEFAVIMQDISYDCALETAHKIRQSIAETRLPFTSDEAGLTLSAGIYHGTGDGLDYEAIMRLADKELYQSKSKGRNRVSTIKIA